MWVMKVVGCIAHGKCPEIEYDADLWVGTMSGEKKVKLVAKLEKALRYASEAEAREVAKLPLLELFIIRVMRVDGV